MLYDVIEWKEDLDVIMNSLPELDSLIEKSILITGATGLVCSPIVDLFIHYNEMHGRKIHIYACSRDYNKIKKRFGKYCERDYFHFVLYYADQNEFTLQEKVDFIIHGAGNSSPQSIIKEPVETMLSNIDGLKNLLNYTVLQGVKRILYISSSEVYGVLHRSEPLTEKEYGFHDILNVRSSYPIGKMAAETLCSAYAAEYGISTVIVRPGHIYGPTALPSDGHIASKWAYDGLKRTDIVMKSDGLQIRSYCYCLDCASAIIKVLLCGKDGHAYNISNPDSIITVRQYADILSKACGVKLRIEAPSEKEKAGFNKMKNSSLDSSRLQGLGWKGYFDAETGIRQMMSILENEHNNIT